ncbi:zinc ribbon domain-containing protein [Massiliimalia timonensis]|uniref:zinc ribbon domain-containing protein n=1 Tax=Massiliimalia timonensis TaxID=1987501 RepID=UPI00189EB355|nr:zinc ribbon domain-containing protein [Massiliimalia timonensis]
MYCPKCGADNKDTSTYCSQCGNSLSTEKKKEAVNLKKVGAIISLIASAILLLFILAASFNAFMEGVLNGSGEGIENPDVSIEMIIGTEYNDTVQTILECFICGGYAISITIGIISSIKILKGRKGKHLIILSWIASIILLLNIALVSLNCCGVILFVFPFTMIIGNILTTIGYFNEKNS